MMERRLTTTPIAIALWAAAASTASTQEWPRWRGPEQTGGINREAFPAEPFGFEIAWQKRLGSGYGSVSIERSVAVVMASDGTSDNVIAFDADTGDEKWRHAFAPTYEGREGGSSPGPPGTPTLADGVVYALGPRGQLMALELATGALLWSREIHEQDGAVRPFYGFATAPLVVGQRLVVQTGGSAGHAITAYDRATGARRWARGSDGLDYQSPVLVALEGREQILAVSNTELAGIDPETGTMLWQGEHASRDRQGQIAQPLPIGDDRFLVTSRSTGSTMYRVIRDGDDARWSVEQVWKDRAFSGSYAVPVFHDGYLYGFRGNFLGCVDADTGAQVWRSRPPGGNGLILVDGHLVVFTADGMLVAVEAVPDGYVEKARAPVTDRGSHAPPSFANGHVFVRNLEDIFSLRVTDAGAPTDDAEDDAEEDAFPNSMFTAFIRRVKSADEDRRAELIRGFMASQESFPIIEGDTLVHFVYRGDAADVAVLGSMVDLYPRDNAAPLARIEGTDFFYRSFELEPNARWDYQFIVDFDNVVNDPLNEQQVPERMGRGDVSEIAMPQWRRPQHLEPVATPRGRFESFSLTSVSFEKPREIRVYLPAGYDHANTRYPLLIVNNGVQDLELALTERSLENLIGTRVAPIIAAFVEVHGLEEQIGELVNPFAQMLVDELVPELDRRFRTKASASERAIMGRFRGGTVPLYAALRYPDTFSKLALQTYNPVERLEPEIERLIRSRSNPGLVVYADWGRYAFRSKELGADLRADALRLNQWLAAAGVELHGGEAVEGDGWGSWRSRTDLLLESLFPLEENP